MSLVISGLLVVVLLLAAEACRFERRYEAFLTQGPDKKGAWRIGIGLSDVLYDIYIHKDHEGTCWQI